jgi:hypothetical protein
MFVVDEVIGSDDDDDDEVGNDCLLDVVVVVVVVAVDDDKGFSPICIFGSHSIDVKLLSNGMPVAIPVAGFFLPCDFRTSISFYSRKKNDVVTMSETN